MVSTLHAAASAHLVVEYAPLLESPPPQATSDTTGFVASLKRVTSAVFSFLSVSLPIAILHIAIFAGFVLLSLNASPLRLLC